MKPGLGKGTVLMTLFSNHSIGRVLASLLTAVSLRRVSIGPPISVIEAGCIGSLRDAISAAAASTGTAGWQTAITCVFAPEILDELDDVIDEIVQIERARADRHHARVRPIGDVDIVLADHRLDRAAQQRRVMARKRRDDQHLGIVAAADHLLFAVEMQRDCRTACW